MLGEGVGMLALKRLADAERDGDAVHAVIRGIGTSSDGRVNSIYAPAPSGQVIVRAALSTHLSSGRAPCCDCSTEPSAQRCERAAASNTVRSASSRPRRRPCRRAVGLDELAPSRP